MPYVASLFFLDISISTMSHVDFKKWLSHRGKFRGQGPHIGRQKVSMKLLCESGLILSTLLSIYCVYIFMPIFHCDAKPLTLGPGVGTPNATILRWVYQHRIGITPDAKPKICVSPNAKPECKSVEYRLRWVPNANLSRWACTFHILCVDFICVG